MFFFIFVLLTGCDTALNRSKKEMLEIYSNDENYITLTGEIIEIEEKENNIWVKIKCKELLEYIKNEKEICNYWVFAESIIDVNVGDIISYTTVKIKYNEWLPIVSIEKNNKTVLEYQTGKKNLLDWVNQLQMK